MQSASQLKKFDKQEVSSLASQFIKVAGDANDAAAQRRVAQSLAPYRLGLFRIAVIGEIKKGKSSFINALLGEDLLLPTASDVATSTVYKIMYGERRRAKVFFESRVDGAAEAEGGSLEKRVASAAKPDPIEVPFDSIPAYGTEDENRGHEKGVDFIGIQLPNPLLKQGIVIVDTPGLGGLFEKHREIAMRYLSSADAVFFVMDSVEAVASQAEVDMLQRVRKYTPLVFFVQTKTDLVDESQWMQWRNRNLEIIEKAVKIPRKKLIYFPVSATLKSEADATCDPDLLELSGYVPLVYFIQNKLLAAKETQLTRGLLSQISAESGALAEKLNERLRIAQAENHEQLDQLKSEYEEAKRDHERWKRDELNTAIEDFQRGAAELRRKHRQRLTEELDPSPYGPVVRPVVDRLRVEEWNPKELNEQVEWFIGPCINECTDLIFTVQQEYNRDIKRLAEDLSQSLQSPLRPVDSATSAETWIDQQQTSVGSLNMKFDRFDEGRNALYGGMAGAMMANVGTGVLAFVFPPAAAVAGIATLVGVAAGGWKASGSLKTKRRDEALRKMEQVAGDAIQRIRNRALSRFDAAASDCESHMNRSVREQITAASRELEDRFAAISRARQASQTEKKDEVNTLAKDIRRARQIAECAGKMNNSYGGRSSTNG